MDQKTWKTSALYYGFVILLIFLGFVFFTNRSSQPAEKEGRASSSLRIVSLAPNLTEILFALDLGNEVIAVSSDSNFPAEALTKKRVGSFWNPDLEAVLAARPNLVFTLGFQQQTNLTAQLKKIGCRTVSLDIESISQLYEAIEIIGTLTDRREAAGRLVDQIAGGLQKFRVTPGETAPVKVLWVVQRQPVRAAGRNTFINELMKIAGIENAVETTLYQYPPLTEEQIIASSPEVIIETADSPEDFLRQQATAKDFYSRFKTIPAVKDNRIFVIDGDLVCRLGPRLPLGMEAIVDCIRPEKPGQERTHADF